MLIDRFLPHSDFREYHAIIVRADPERIYEVIRHGDLTKHPVVRLLLKLRGVRGSAAFTVLAEDPQREIVLGIEGPFWKPNCKGTPIDAQSFQRPVPSGSARAAWNFAIEPRGDGTALVSTETRVLCANWRFRAYWLVVRPFSGLIRRLMLREIRKESGRPGRIDRASRSIV